MSGFQIYTLLVYLWPILLLLIGWVFGRMNERAHYKRLDTAEAELSHIQLSNLYNVDHRDDAVSGVMVQGSVTVANDAFKRFLAFFRKLFGGRLGMYERLMERARREAIVRMKRQARDLGATEIIGLRLQGVGLTGKNGTTGATEMLAYGTALLSKDPSNHV